MKQKLGHITKAGLGSYDTPQPTGEVAFLHGGQFDERGRLASPPETFTDINAKVQKQLLEPGDVLLAGKGFRNFAWCYQGSMHQRWPRPSSS